MNHGLTAYTHGKCKCDQCRRAYRLYRNQLRRRAGEPPVHGNSGYTNYGCRCGICTAAATARGRAYRARLKAAAAP